MSPSHCPRCAAPLPAVHDGFCPSCRGPLGFAADGGTEPVTPQRAPEASPPGPAAAEAMRQEAFRVWHAELRQLTPRAPVTPILVALNCLVFLAMGVAGMNPLSPTVDGLLEWGANFGPATFSGEPWRLLTSAFLHGGLGHLAFNMFSLFGVGLITERMLGSPGFLLTYLLTALAGSLTSIAWSPAMVSVGASGAVFGVFGAFFAACLRASDTIPKPALDATRKNMGQLLLINLVFGFFVPNIDVAAHVGGLVCGFGCGFLLGHPFRVESREKRLSRNLVLLVLSIPVLALGAVVAGSRVEGGDNPFKELARVGADEEKVLKAYNDALSRAEKGTLSDAEFVVILDRDVLAPWRDLKERFDRVKGSSSLDPVRMKQLGDYFATRGDGFELFRKALATNDMAAAEQSRAKMEQADRMVQALNQPASKGR